MELFLTNIAQELGLQTVIPAPRRVPALPRDNNLLLDLLCQLAEADSPDLLLRCHLPLMWLVSVACERAKLSAPEVGTVRSLVTQTLGLLASEHRRCQGRKLWPRPARPFVRKPRYAIFLSAHNCECGQVHDWSDLDTHLPQTFRSLAWDAITGLIKWQGLISQEQWQEMGLAYRISWSIRCLIRKSPNLVFPDLQMMLSEGKRIRNAFAQRHEELSRQRGYAKIFGEERLGEIKEAYIDHHVFNLHTVQSGRFRRKRSSRVRVSRAATLWRRDAEAVEGLEYIYPAAENAIKVVSPRLTGKQLRRMLAEGLAPEEDDPQPAVELPTPSGGKQEYLQRVIRAGLIYDREEAVPWGRRAPGFQELAIAYAQWFPRPWAELDATHRLSAFEAMVYLHAGIHPELLAEIKVGQDVDASDLLWRHGIYLDVHLKTFVLQTPIISGQKNQGKHKVEGKSSGNSLPAHAVACPLPPLLASMLDYLLTHDFPAKSGETWVPAATARAQILAQGPTAIKINRAFYRYYCTWYGLDPELASLVAGRPVANRAANSHYFQTSYHLLEQAYHKVFNQFHADIMMSARASGHVVHSPEDLRSTKPPLPTATLGSRITPTIEDVAGWLSRLHQKLEDLSTSEPRHIDNWRNILCLYTCEALKVCTGLRALARPPFTSYSLIGDPRWLRLAEKASGNWDEWRMVPVHPRVTALVFMLIKYNNLVMTRIHRGHPETGALPDLNSLFFITRAGKAQPLSFPLLKATARSYGLAYPSFAANAFRHLLCSWLHQRGRSHRLADFALGHHRLSPHALDRLSLTPLARLENEFLGAVGQLLNAIDLQMVEEI